jgi:hypothetical protein
MARLVSVMSTDHARPPAALVALFLQPIEQGRQAARPHHAYRVHRENFMDRRLRPIVFVASLSLALAASALALTPLGAAAAPEAQVACLGGPCPPPPGPWGAPPPGPWGGPPPGPWTGPPDPGSYADVVAFTDYANLTTAIGYQNVVTAVTYQNLANAAAYRNAVRVATYQAAVSQR